MRKPQPLFGQVGPGYLADMQYSDDFSDDIPVADAVEQQRAITEPVLDEEDAVEPPTDRPLEAAGADWQEQLEAVDYDPDDGMTDS